MVLCPKCGASVEGLIYYCNCCGAELNKIKKFIVCAIFEMPECLEFASLSREIINSIQPDDTLQYSSFLEQIGISLICYPNSILKDGNIKEQLRYYKKKKYVSLTLLVNYNSFVVASSDEKARLIASALKRGFDLLDGRMACENKNIQDLTSYIRNVIDHYL